MTTKLLELQLRRVLQKQPHTSQDRYAIKAILTTVRTYFGAAAVCQVYQRAREQR